MGSQNIWSLAEWAGSVDWEGSCFHNVLQTGPDLCQDHNLENTGTFHMD